jgi:hypothetical protein
MKDEFDYNYKPEDYWSISVGVELGSRFLPSFLENEIEIARVQVKTKLGNIISLRARKTANGMIQYRAVDENYIPSEPLAYECSPNESMLPLSLIEVIDLLNGIKSTHHLSENDRGVTNVFRDSEWEWLKEDYDASFLLDYVTVTSEVYPELRNWYEQEAQSWVEKHSRQIGEDDLTQKKFPDKLGLGILDKNSIMESNGKSQARYYFEPGDLVYDISIDEESCIITEFFEDRLIGETKSKTLNDAFVNKFRTFNAHEHFRSKRIIERLSSEMNAYFLPFSNKRALNYPAGLHFILRIPIFNRFQETLIEKESENILSLDLSLHNIYDGVLLKFFDNATGESSITNELRMTSDPPYTALPIRVADFLTTLLDLEESVEYCLNRNLIAENENAEHCIIVMEFTQSEVGTIFTIPSKKQNTAQYSILPQREKDMSIGDALEFFGVPFKRQITSLSDALSKAEESWMNHNQDRCRESLEYYFEFMTKDEAKNITFTSLENAVIWTDMIHQTGILDSSDNEIIILVLKKASELINTRIMEFEEAIENRESRFLQLCKAGFDEFDYKQMIYHDWQARDVESLIRTEKKYEVEQERDSASINSISKITSNDAQILKKSDFPDAVRVVLFSNPCGQKSVICAQNSYFWNERVICFPDDFKMLKELSTIIISRFVEDDIILGLKKYPEVSLLSACPVIAKDGSIGEGETFGVIELGLSLELQGPLIAIRAAISELAGLQKAQKRQFLVYNCADDQVEENGNFIEFQFLPEHSISRIQEILNDNNIEDFKVEITSNGNWFRNYVHDENETVIEEIVRIFSAFGVSDTFQIQRCHIQIIGAVGHDTSYVGHEEYETHIIKHFGYERGRKISESARSAGTLFKFQVSGIGPHSLKRMNASMYKLLICLKGEQIIKDKIIKLPESEDAISVFRSHGESNTGLKISAPHINLGGGYFFHNKFAFRKSRIQK